MTESPAGNPPVIRPIAVPADRSSEKFLWSDLPFDPERVRLYALGAPYALLAVNPMDDFSFPDQHEPPEEVRETIREWWGVNEADDCRSNLARLCEVQMFSTYDHVTPLVEKALEFPPGHRIEEAHSDFLTDLERANGWSPGVAQSAYHRWLATLRRPEIRGLLPDALPLAGYAWDLMRTVSFGRASHSAGYLTAGEVGGYIATALRNAQDLAPDWRAYASSFLAARIFWSIDNTPEDTLAEAQMWAEAIRRCLADPDSPWTAVTLHPSG